MQETLEFIRLVDRVSTAVANIPQRAATHAVNFSKERFRSQNWVDSRTEPWKKRKGRDKRAGRAILVDKGRLRRSVRKIIVTSIYAIIGTNVPYARPNNYGFRGRVSVKRHTRKGSEVKAHTRNVNLQRRQFIGVSAVMDNQIQRLMTTDIQTAIKNR